MENTPQRTPSETMLPSPHIEIANEPYDYSEEAKQANLESINSTLKYMSEGGDIKDLADSQIYQSNAEKTRETITDPMTGLLNRKGMELWMERNRPEAFGVIFADGQSFGHINKQHGHDVGDEVIRHIGSEIMHKFRTGTSEAVDERRSDTESRDAISVTRWGGDEFFIVIDLSNVPSDQREKVLEMAQDRLKNFGEYSYHDATGNNVSIPISIDSVGAIGFSEIDDSGQDVTKSLEDFRRELDPILSEKKRARKAELAGSN